VINDGLVSASQEAYCVDGNRFHLVWLRDNCRCSHCRDPSTTQKLFDITAGDLRPRIYRANLDADCLRIIWDEDPQHESIYRRDWLQDHAYDGAIAPPAQEDLQLWRGSDLAGTRLVSHQVEDPIWREEVFHRGFTLLGGLDQPAYEALLHETGPIQPTEFGEIAPLRAIPDANDIGETGLALDPHTDYMYMHFPPTLNFLHCICNDSDGGASTLVDGFAVARHLRDNNPVAFNRLVQTPLPFHQVYSRWRFHHKRCRPMIELDEHDAISGIFVGHPHTRNWQLPFGEMVPTYEAYAQFIKMLNDPSWQLQYRLKPGECLVFRNERVLHGRTGFSPVSGERHLQVAFVCWSYFSARERFLTGQRE